MNKLISLKAVLTKIFLSIIIMFYFYNSYAQHIPELRVFAKGKSGVTSVIFSPEGDYFAAASGKLIQIWNTNGNLKNTFEGHTDKVSSISNVWFLSKLNFSFNLDQNSGSSFGKPKSWAQIMSSKW